VRQGRQRAETREFWERMCLCAEKLARIRGLGAIHEGELVAALLSYTFEDTVSILYQQSRTCHLKYGVNNALAYFLPRPSFSVLVPGAFLWTPFFGCSARSG
jgi:hypothetical protein